MKVLIASGGSGGHIFPAVALARELTGDGSDIVFVASKRGLDRKILERERYQKVFLSANPMPYSLNPVRVSVFLCKLVFDSFRAAAILIRNKPDVCVGFGGYTAGSIIFLVGCLLFIITLVIKKRQSEDKERGEFHYESRSI